VYIEVRAFSSKIHTEFSLGPYLYNISIHSTLHILQIGVETFNRDQKHTKYDSYSYLDEINYFAYNQLVRFLPSFSFMFPFLACLIWEYNLDQNFCSECKFE